MQWMRMTRRAHVPWALVVCSFAVLGCAGDATGPASDRPSVLLITVDGLVAGDLSPFGGDQPMPQLQRLADQGKVWPTALSAVPMTRPAVATYLTGLAPDRHGVRDDLFAVLSPDIPTLAERLHDAGYRTAGFPDSAFLPEPSGLWRGFEDVHRPPPVIINASRWLPRFRPTKLTWDALSAWLDGLDESADWFGWVHLSHPVVGQLKQRYFETGGANEAAADEEQKAIGATDVGSYQETLADFDTLLGQILDRVDARGDGSRTWILLAGTFADQRSGESGVLPGPGYSLDPRLIEVPLIVRSPQGVEIGRGAGETVWAPDIAATIAKIAGVELSPQAEGVSLTEIEPERIVFSWSWALLDQLGWRALALARNGERELLVGSAPAAAAHADPALEDLRRALDARANPPRVGLPDDVVSSLLAEFDVFSVRPLRGEEPLELEAIPSDGRDFDDAALREEIAGKIWVARSKYHNRDIQPGIEILRQMAQKDPQSYVAYLDRGQMMTLVGRGKLAERIMKRAIQLRPDDPEAWHWLAHARWATSWEEAEKIVSAIQPYLAQQSDALYDLACARSLAGDLEVSADYLERAYLAGFRDRTHISADPDLRNLRESEHFSRVMQRFH